MNKQEFLDLVWRLDEILIHRDNLRSQIGKCGNGCDDEDEDEGLCPECCEVFEKLQEEDDRLAKNKELDAVLKALRQEPRSDRPSGKHEVQPAKRRKLRRCRCRR